MLRGRPGLPGLLGLLRVVIEQEQEQDNVRQVHAMVQLCALVDQVLRPRGTLPHHVVHSMRLGVDGLDGVDGQQHVHRDLVRDQGHVVEQCVWVP